MQSSASKAALPCRPLALVVQGTCTMRPLPPISARRIAGCPDNSTFPLPEIEPSASTWAVIFALPLPRIVTVADFAIRPSNWASPEPEMLSLMRLQFPSQRNSRCLDVHLKLWLVDLG